MKAAIDRLYLTLVGIALVGGTCTAIGCASAPDQRATQDPCQCAPEDTWNQPPPAPAAYEATQAAGEVKPQPENPEQ